MIPIHTTLITVYRTVVAADQDPTEVDSGSRTTVAEHVRAQISSPSGRERNIGGSQEIVEFSLSCDPVDLTNLDQVYDETTGEMYEVTWARQRTGFGLDHTRAGLRAVKGVTPAGLLI